ncbi:MAG: hypothetical protein KAS59_07595 [Alphaproteobacteria bacterium]|nr:hypothetical protein [Alphaproteobacteria bacterium]
MMEKLERIMSFGMKGILYLFLVYAVLVILFLIGMGIFALVNGNFEKFWTMLMSV